MLRKKVNELKWEAKRKIGIGQAKGMKKKNKNKKRRIGKESKKVLVEGEEEGEEEDVEEVKGESRRNNIKKKRVRILKGILGIWKGKLKRERKE